MSTSCRSLLLCSCASLLFLPGADAFAGNTCMPPMMPTRHNAMVNLRRKASQSQSRSGPEIALHLLRRIPRGGATPESSSSSLSASPGVIFDNAPFLQSLGVFSAANGLGALLSLSAKSELHVDLLGTGAFALAAIPPLIAKGRAVARVKVSAAAMAIWATKLAAFLLYRIIKMNHDARLGDVFGTVSGTVGFWVFSLLWGVLCSLPHTLGTTSSLTGNPIALALGASLYAVGIVIETAADYQKWMFKQTNPGKFCNVGLWSISQHPNFFGNFLLWVGIFVMNAPALIEPSVTAAGSDMGLWETLWGFRRLALAMLGPAFMWFLFASQADGNLTNAVELANARYRDDPEYVKYIKEVPKIVPNFIAGGK